MAPADSEMMCGITGPFSGGHRAVLTAADSGEKLGWVLRRRYSRVNLSYYRCVGFPRGESDEAGERWLVCPDMELYHNKRLTSALIISVYQR